MSLLLGCVLVQDHNRWLRRLYLPKYVHSFKTFHLFLDNDFKILTRIMRWEVTLALWTHWQVLPLAVSHGFPLALYRSNCRLRVHLQVLPMNYSYSPIYLYDKATLRYRLFVKQRRKLVCRSWLWRTGRRHTSCDWSLPRTRLSLSNCDTDSDPLNHLKDKK